MNHSLPLFDGVYRLNPAFHLMKHKELHEDHRAVFDALAEDDDHYGFLVSDEIPELGIQAVDRDGAHLFSQLQAASGVRDLPPDPLKLAAFVLDGILEFQSKGGFVSGPTAYRALFGAPFPCLKPADELARLSFQAVRLAQQLPSAEARQISSWLYRYNGVPLTSSWAGRIMTAEQREGFLGLEIGAKTRTLLDANFISFDVPGWRAWRRADAPDTLAEGAPAFKLYVSPHPSVLPEAFARTVNLFVELGVFTFKLGRDAFGLLRPDKLVAYFDEEAHFEEVKAQMDEALRAFPAQGVPFTASVSVNGLVSWGVDPPREEAIPGWNSILSWRKWITDRLARSILRARVLGCAEAESWQFALNRLSLDGVNVENWTPRMEVWR